MPRDLREAVAIAIYETECGCTIPDDMPMEGFMAGYGPVADAAISAVLDWLIAEADTARESFISFDGDPDQELWVADWLRSFRPEAGQ